MKCLPGCIRGHTAGGYRCIPGVVLYGAAIVIDSVAGEVFSPVREDYLPFAA
jgi:hypothetical protein